MSEIMSVLRTENKYLLTQEQYFHLKRYFSQTLRQDPHNTISGYMVRSLYFDTVDDRDYYDKLDGLENRRKLRLRTYSPNAPGVKLEIKEKWGSCQRKRSLTVTREQARSMAKGCFSPLDQIGGPFAQELKNLAVCGVYRPKCVIEYRRFAYISPVNNIRVTFDMDLRAGLSAWGFFERHPGLCPVMGPGQVLMEVKFDHFMLSYIKDVISACNASPVALSKYCLARTVGT